MTETEKGNGMGNGIRRVQLYNMVWGWDECYVHRWNTVMIERKETRIQETKNYRNNSNMYRTTALITHISPTRTLPKREITSIALPFISWYRPERSISRHYGETTRHIL